MAWYDSLFPQDYGYPGVTPQMRTQGILAALQRAGGILAQGAGTQGWGALSAALGAAPELYREDLGKRYEIKREEDKAALDREYRQSLMDERESARKARKDAAREREEERAAKAEQLQKRIEERQAKIDDLVGQFPGKEAAIRKRLSPFLTESNFEERWAAMLDTLSPMVPKAGEKAKLVRVTRPDGSVVMVPEQEGMQVEPPTTTAKGGIYYKPGEVADKLQAALKRYTPKHGAADADPAEVRSWYDKAWRDVQGFIPPDYRDQAKSSWFQPFQEDAAGPTREDFRLPPNTPPPVAPGSATRGQAPAGDQPGELAAIQELRKLMPTLDEEHKRAVAALLARGRSASEILRALQQ